MRALRPTKLSKLSWLDLQFIVLKRSTIPIKKKNVKRKKTWKYQ